MALSKLEMDNDRITSYQHLKNNLIAVSEYFRHGDVLIREVNNILKKCKTAIDEQQETTWTKDDFDYMLMLRNDVLLPIFQNASFAEEFSYYTEPTISSGEQSEITE